MAILFYLRNDAFLGFPNMCLFVKRDRVHHESGNGIHERGCVHVMNDYQSLAIAKTHPSCFFALVRLDSAKNHVS